MLLVCHHMCMFHCGRDFAGVYTEKQVTTSQVGCVLVGKAEPVEKHHKFDAHSGMLFKILPGKIA